MLRETKVSDGVVRRHEILKNNIHTILKELSPYTKEYPSEEQEVLIKFIDVIQHFEQAEYNRDELSARFEEYINYYTGTNQYLRTPFLWFSLDFSSNANLILSTAKFHAEGYFNYLISYLRNIFQLVRAGTSLSNSEAFEPLQYDCNKLLVPLTDNQLSALNSLYSNIHTLSYLALDPQRIKNLFRKYINTKKSSRDIVSFIKLLDIKFFLLFNLRAFDLEQIYIHFQLNDNISLKEVIDFQDITNTVLCSSEILEVRGKQNTYVGLLLSPTQYSSQLKNYLENLVNLGKIKIYEMTDITISQWFTSLALYKAGKGWGTLNNSQLKRLAEQLKTKNPRQARLQPFFMTPSFKPIWHFQMHEKPVEVIKLFCDIPREFSYEHLPLNPINNLNTFQFLPEEPEKLLVFRELHRNQVSHIGFRSHRLWYEWGLDAFFVKLPLIPRKQLVRLLQWFPFSQLFRSENYWYIYVRLPPKRAQWIQNDLNWTILPVMRHQYPLKLHSEWFDEEKIRWKCPSGLKTHFN